MIEHGFAGRDRIAPDAPKKFPYRPYKIHTRLHKDGSVVDQ